MNVDALKLFFSVYLFLRERERERDRQTERDRAQEEGQRERETQNPKQAPGFKLSAQSPMRVWNPPTGRS